MVGASKDSKLTTSELIHEMVSKMKKLKVLSVFGTRAEAVKMAPVVKALKAAPEIESSVCVTAQHREMLDQVLDIFHIQPDFDLNLMKDNQTLGEMASRIFTDLDPVYRQVQPDWVLVQGDTTTVVSAALLAYYHRIRVGHVEAGLRTNDKWQPFPEEINRRVAGVVADLHFAPTEFSRKNLLREGVSPDSILLTGNPVIDALIEIASLPKPDEANCLLNELGVVPGKKRLIMVTAHRRENFGKPLEDICAALRGLAEKYGDELALVYSVHLNPNVQETVYRLLSNVQGITLLKPLPYLTMVHMLKYATLVLTDSGGIQEEATALKIPTLVMRDVTERPEGVDAGVLKLVGSNTQRIISETSHLLDDPHAYQSMQKSKNPFGDGHAAEKIVEALLRYRG